MAAVEGLIETLFHSESNSLLKKCLTKDLADQLKDKKTKFGGTLEHCIRSGVENLDSGTGLYASDEEAYTVFQPLFDEVIKAYHKCPRIQHPAPDFGDLSALPFGDLDPEGKNIVSTRVRVGRSQEGYGFPPTLNKTKRLEMEERAKKALEGLQGELAGTYCPLTGMSRDMQQKLVDDHFLFNDHDRFLRSACGYDDWPAGRGIFHNHNKTFLVWVNEEDHLRVISMQPGGDLAQVWTRLVTGVRELEQTMPYSKSDRLGYLTFCPTNLGTTLRASVHMRIPTLDSLLGPAKLKDICREINIDIRGIHGEHSASEGAVYDISNRNRLGLTEINAAQQMVQGVKFLLNLERALSKITA